MPDSVSDPLAQHVDHLQDNPASSPSLLMRGEKLLSLASAAKASRVPGHRGAPHPNPSTLFRHVTRGVRTPSGQVIRLEAVRIGQRWLTSLEAVARFAERLTAAQLRPTETPSDASANPQNPRQRARQQAASKRLDALLERKATVRAQRVQPEGNPT